MVALFGMWQWLKLVVVSDGRPDGPAPATGAVTARVQAADLFISEVLSITFNYCDKMKLIRNGIHHKPQLVMWMEIVTLLTLCLRYFLFYYSQSLHII
ncbi:hypothetical protein Hanom_Chr06g00524371 [Helianthus anomalus]